MPAQSNDEQFPCVSKAVCRQMALEQPAQGPPTDAVVVMMLAHDDPSIQQHKNNKITGMGHTA